MPTKKQKKQVALRDQSPYVVCACLNQYTYIFVHLCVFMCMKFIKVIDSLPCSFSVTYFALHVNCCDIQRFLRFRCPNSSKPSGSRSGPSRRPPFRSTFSAGHESVVSQIQTVAAHGANHARSTSKQKSLLLSGQQKKTWDGVKNLCISFRASTS